MYTKPPRLPSFSGKYHLPFPEGKYPIIGYHDIMTGTNQSDGVFIRLIYPAEEQSINLCERHSEWPNWYPHQNYKIGYSQVMPPRLSPVARFLQYAAGDYFIPILPNLKPSANKFPVIVFSHGIASNRTTYSNICNQLASNGFIVAVIEHRDESACATCVPSKENSEFNWLQYKKSSQFVGNEYDVRQVQLQIRVNEVQRTLDLLRKLNKGEQIENIFNNYSTHSDECLENRNDRHIDFKNVMDTNKLILAGHSYGGATVICGLKEIPEFQIGICLDSWMFPVKEVKPEDVKQPLLFVNMETFQSESSLIKMNQFLQNSKTVQVWTINNTRHTDISDFPLLVMAFSTWVTSAINWLIPLQSKANPYHIHEATVSMCLNFIQNNINIGASKAAQIPTEIEVTEGIQLKIK